jgi:hypothetical protein
VSTRGNAPFVHGPFPSVVNRRWIDFLIWAAS